MLKEEMEKLRERINQLVVSEDIMSDDLLRASREMDNIIVKHLKKNVKKLNGNKESDISDSEL